MNKFKRIAAVSKQTQDLLAFCRLCPRECKINRLKDEKGFCKTGIRARVYNFLAHHGEEPAISGSRGSGTIFFSGCNMSCIYCQNHEFSQKEGGREVDSLTLADYMLQLQKLGCHNINLVSPTHVMPQILDSLSIAISRGLEIPLVYNTGGYESAEIIALLEGIIDIYLPDMRYADSDIAKKYSLAPDYPCYNQQTVKEMHRQAGIAKLNAEGIIESGLIIRHLVLPNSLSGTEKIMKFIAEELSSKTYISLMSQYSPYYQAESYPEINRRITQGEYRKAEEIMRGYGLYNGWTQDDHGLERFAGENIKPL